MGSAAIPLKPDSNRMVVFTDNNVSSNDITIPYGDILGITFYSGYSRGRFIYRSAGILILRSAATRLKIAIRNFSFWEHDVNEVSNYTKICEEVMTRIGPTVLQRLATDILAGRTVTIGSLAVDSAGVTCTGMFGGRRRATWDLSPEVRNTFKDHWYVAMTQLGVLEVSYFYPLTGKMIAVGSVTSRDENDCLLPTLIRFMTALNRSRNA